MFGQIYIDIKNFYISFTTQEITNEMHAFKLQLFLQLSGIRYRW